MSVVEEVEPPSVIEPSLGRDIDRDDLTASLRLVPPLDELPRLETEQKIRFIVEGRPLRRRFAQLSGVSDLAVRLFFDEWVAQAGVDSTELENTPLAKLLPASESEGHYNIEEQSLISYLEANINQRVSERELCELWLKNTDKSDTSEWPEVLTRFMAKLKLDSLYQPQLRVFFGDKGQLFTFISVDRLWH